MIIFMTTTNLENIIKYTNFNQMEYFRQNFSFNHIKYIYRNALADNLILHRLIDSGCPILNNQLFVELNNGFT